jgi:hypothetical protein
MKEWHAGQLHKYITSCMLKAESLIRMHHGRLQPGKDQTSGHKKLENGRTSSMEEQGHTNTADGNNNQQVSG